MPTPARSLEFHLYLPQMRMSFDDLVGRTQAAEAAGFDGMAMMDHLAPPLAEQHPMYEAMVTATWLAAHTERMTIGHLVLCDSFRHPAILAKQVVSIDHASGGRFELGIGWGSVPTEFDTFGVGSTDPKERVARLAETLEVLQELWSGEAVDFDGDFHQVRAGRQRPVPLSRIPLVIGGVGRRTLELVAAHADWWNVPVNALDRLDELKSRVGRARVSVQEMVSLVRTEADRLAVTQMTERRYGDWGRPPLIASVEELVQHFTRRREQGVERFYVWFTDFAVEPTLERFSEVISAFR